MKAEYRKEPGKHYLIIKPEEPENEFAVHMLLENKISGLLPFEKRMFNGETQFYYDISGKHAIQTGLHQEQHPQNAQPHLLSGKEICGMLRRLYCLADNLSSHFLDLKGVVLDPAFIYGDDREFYFCYNPSSESEVQEVLAGFAEEMLDYIDHDDEEAVMLGYQFYKKVKSGERTLLQILEETLSEEEEVTSGKKFSEETKVGTEQLSDKTEWTEHDTTAEEITEEGAERLFWREKPDIGTLLCFVPALIVSLGYLYEIYTASGGVSLSVIRDGQGGWLALLFAFLSIPGMAAGFVNIDIKEKK